MMYGKIRGGRFALRRTRLLSCGNVRLLPRHLDEFCVVSWSCLLLSLLLVGGGFTAAAAGSELIDFVFYSTCALLVDPRCYDVLTASGNARQW